MAEHRIWTDQIPPCLYCRHLADWGALPMDPTLWQLRCGLSEQEIGRPTCVVFDRIGGRLGIPYQSVTPCARYDPLHWPHFPQPTDNERLPVGALSSQQPTVVAKRIG